MAIETTLTPQSVAPPVSMRADELETAQLDPTRAPRRDPLSMLDHRSRGRAVARQLALPGHYIGLEDGAGEQFLISLDTKIVHIGRATTADLRFEDAHVSRRHAIVVRYGRHVRVLDDRSSAGTFVNGLRVIATDLEDGDVVRIGPIAFTYVVIG